jgi:outer membrane protein assembly complex protein YaeT
MIRTLRATLCWELAIVALIGLASTSVADSPAGKDIAEVVIEGNRVRTTDQIMAQLDSRPGRTFNINVAQEDVRRLLAKGWFPPTGVQLLTKERPDGRLTVRIVVTELPNTVKKITYLGADHIGTDEIKKITELKEGEPMSPAKNQQARNAIIRHYHEKGRFWATVKIVKGELLVDEEVVFDIAEGPSVKIGSVKFEFFGPTTDDISTGRLRTQIQSSKAILGLIGGEFDAVKVDLDIVKLSEYYHNLGYLYAKIQRELIWSEDHKSVTVVFHIEEGSRFKVKQIQIDGSKIYNEASLLNYTDLRKGSFYDKFVVEADIKRLRDFYGYQGRPVIVRESYASVGEGEVNVHYQIEEREPVRVKDVLIYGNTVTRDNVIRRQLDIYPGQILSYPDLLVAQQRLSRLGIFEEDPQTGVKPMVEVDHPEIDEPFKTINVGVREKPTGSFMVGAGVTSNAGLNGSIVINERNFDITRLPTSWDDVFEGRAWRGAGQEFRIEAVPGTVFSRYTVSFREPYLFDSRYSFGSSFYYFQRFYTGYTEERVGGRFTFSRRLDPNWSVNFTERIEQVGISQIPLGAPPEIADFQGHSNIFGQRLSVTYDARDNILRPTNGEMIDIGAEEVLGSYQFPIVTGEFKKFFTTFQRKDGSGKQVLAFKSQASWEGSNAPVFERFYAGGMQSIRGFIFRGVGPFINGYNVGGNFMWLNSLEYQIPVMANDQLYFVSFIDSGTVEPSVQIKDYRVTAGLGMRISIPQLLGPVPLALDFGVPIVQGPYDQRQLFSFWLGFFN